MPTAGLSLVGFMDQAQAFNHLRFACIPADSRDAALNAEIAVAKGKLGPKFANAGKPDIQNIEAQFHPYVQSLCQLPWIAPYVGLPGVDFKMVEIDSLLAYQFSVDKMRSDHHCGHLPKPPTVNDLLPLCLPTVQPNEQINLSQQEHSMILKSRSLNFRVMGAGMLAQGQAGINFGVSLPLTIVVRFNGRCYLHNGYHRSLGIRLSGATHMPCVFRDVATQEEAGIRNDGTTFSLHLLESDNPPTLGHFSQNRAHDISIRASSRIVHINWSDHVMFEE